jgi:heptosyltransferase-2
VYVLKRSFSTALLVWLAGIPRRIGFAADGRSLLLTRVVPRRRARHEAELYLDHLRVDGVEVDDGRNENWVAPETAAKVDGLLAGIAADRQRVFIAPQSSSDHKQWPLDRMAAVVRWLVCERGCEVFLCGAVRDADTHTAIRAHLDAQVAAHVHDFSAALSLRETAALVARMQLCIGVDTGLPHLAASFGVPVVTLFGPTDPHRWHPWRTRHAVVQSGRSPGPMAAIATEQVTAAAARLLEEGAARVAAVRTIDFRTGCFRYEVIEPRPAADARVDRLTETAS